MKILVIPDIHGSWANVIPYIEEHKDEVDKVVTLGDYVDDWDENVNGQPMIDGFNKLIAMAKAEPDKFEILIGNHDNSYISDRRGSSCSGHHWEHALNYSKMFEDNIFAIKAAVEIDGIIFSHAGVTLEWWENEYGRFLEQHYGLYAGKELVEKYEKVLFDYNHIREVYFDGRFFNLLEESEDTKKYNEINGKLHDKLNELWNEMMEKKPKVDFDINILNNTWRSYHSTLNHCSYSSVGNAIGESPIWIRPEALLRSTYPKCKYQVVGHTEIENAPLFLKKGDNKVIVCDNRDHNCAFILDTEKEYDFKEM